ncbi:hypothetical protein [Hahella sp. CCB-MM4]|uniref:hypothetical protein n=1 Tax=Hahella sp. (strain CCB-MM4) TaxID=1926491 RepID=UPI00143DC4C4|nr:hypothetical protein [Hahella sp. CCB-MM4]
MSHCNDASLLTHMHPDSYYMVAEGHYDEKLCVPWTELNAALPCADSSAGY